MKPKENPDYATLQPDFDVDEAWRNMQAGNNPAHLDGVEPPVEEVPPPFTMAQIAFIENLMEETIKRLAVEIRVRDGDSYSSWHTNNEYFNVSVTLNYNRPDGPYNGEQISESSDSFTVHIPSSNNDY